MQASLENEVALASRRRGRHHAVFQTHFHGKLDHVATAVKNALGRLLATESLDAVVSSDGATSFWLRIPRLDLDSSLAGERLAFQSVVRRKA